MTTTTMYADTINGIFDMTKEDLLQQVKDNPFFTNPGEVCAYDTEGHSYTGNELLEMAGVENEMPEKN